jgi:hypothetical protein
MILFILYKNKFHKIYMFGGLLPPQNSSVDNDPSREVLASAIFMLVTLGNYKASWNGVHSAS